MQAIVIREFGDPSVLRLEEGPDPAPGPGEILIDVRAVGVNPYDTYMRTGNYANRPSLPYTPGADGAGVVMALGAGVSTPAVGSRVFFSGTARNQAYGAYAQKVACMPQQAHALPDHLSFSQGAAVGVPYVTAWRALQQRARLRPGETLFVHGASGGVGLAATQIAVGLGARVIGTASTSEGQQTVRDQGAADVLDHHAADYLDRLRELTNGRGPDVILENLANVNLDHDLAAIASGGRIVIVGNRGRIEIDPRRIMGKEAVVTGMSLWNTTLEDWTRAFQAIAAGLASGRLNPQVGTELPLSDAARAHVQILEPGARGKIVLVP